MKWHYLWFVLAAILSLPSVARAGTDWKVVYLEKGTTTGFYDARTATAVGGNSGKTIGEQRRIAFEAAVGIWSKVLSSAVAWTIEAKMTDLPCDAESAVLGQASPSTAVAITAAGSARRLAYPIALANALEASDLQTGDAENPSGAEIFAEFNSAVGNANCLGGQQFYFGLDGNAGNSLDFLGIVLHELGHGFGFSSFLDFETGAPLFARAPDAFSVHAFDLDQQATWDTLNASQLVESIRNARGVVWDGADVKKSAPRFLVKGSPRISVDPSVSGLTGMLSEHDSGPKLADRPAKGPLVIPNPASGCTRPSNLTSLKGAIALVDPQDACSPLEATDRMQTAGALAVLAVDSSATWPPSVIVGILQGQTIPVVSIHPSDAALLKAGTTARTVTLDGDPNVLVGADPSGRIFLNATDPVVKGSSISHWDDLARNQLLMEPSRSAGHRDVDLTREFMRDLGWPICGDAIVQATEACDDGNVYDDTDACDATCTRRVANSSAGGASSSSGETSSAPGGSGSGGTTSSSSGSIPPSSNIAGRDAVLMGAVSTDSGAGCSCRLVPARWRGLPLLLLCMTWLALPRSRRRLRRTGVGAIPTQ